MADLFVGPPELRAYAPAWATPLWDLPEHDPRELVETGDPWWQFLAVVRSEDAERDQFIGLVEEVLRRMEGLARTDPVHWQETTRRILYWAILRRPRPEYLHVLEAVRRAESDAELRKGVEEMAGKIGMTWEQELLLRGEERGRSSGTLESHRKILLNQFRKKFGSLPEDLQRRIDAAELPALEAALDQVLALGALDDLRL